MKYMGSKQKIAKDILSVIFKNSKQTFYFVDLFCGSCSVTELVPEKYIRIANDKNMIFQELLKKMFMTIIEIYIINIIRD